MPRARATPIGIVAELFTILDAISADGVVTTEEASDLHLWLHENRDAGIPQFDLLRTLLDQVLVDGKLTPAEQKSIQAAVERVLPPQLRQKAKAVRIAHQLAMKAKLANEREAKKLRKPIGNFDFMAAGISHEGRSEIVESYIEAGTLIYLVREPSNPFDANAVALRSPQGYSVGYVPREDAELMAPLLDEGASHVAFCKKILHGRRLQIPVVVASLYRGDQAIPNAVKSKDVPPPAIPSFNSKTSHYAESTATAEPSGNMGCVAGAFMALLLMLLAAARC